MSRLRGFAHFWWDFVIGDDWRLAALVIVGLAATSVVAHNTAIPAWWVLPVAVAAGLAVSLRPARPPANRAEKRAVD